MTKAAKIILSVISSAVLLTGCANSQASGSRDSDKPLVYTSFYPMYDLASKAAGEFAEVRCLVPDGTEPHDWEPSPQDVVGLECADLFFYSGSGFEEWIPSVVPKLQNDKLTSIETSAGIPLIGGDPHLWLEPMIAKRQFIAMCDALKAADPSHTAEYERNQKRWSSEFDKLHEEYLKLGELPNNKIIVTHEAFGYLCAAYGLEQIPIVGYSPDAEPDPASMAKIIAIAKESGINAVFYEEMSSPKLARVIADEIGVKTLPLSPLEGLSDDERANGGDYFSVMRANLAALEEALS